MSFFLTVTTPTLYLLAVKRAPGNPRTRLFDAVLRLATNRASVPAHDCSDGVIIAVHCCDARSGNGVRGEIQNFKREPKVRPWVVLTCSLQSSSTGASPNEHIAEDKRYPVVSVIRQALDRFQRVEGLRQTCRLLELLNDVFVGLYQGSLNGLGRATA